MKAFFLFGILFAFSFSTFAQTDLLLSDPLVVNESQAFGFTRPRIALNGEGQPVVLWGRANNLGVYVSSFDGDLFSEPVKITPDGVNAFVQDWAGPGMASAGDTIFATFKSQPEDAGFIFVTRSLDGGKTFGDTVRVSDENWSRFSEISVAPGGNPLITFMSFEPGFHDPHYAVSRSLDGGMTFEVPVDATAGAGGEVCDCCPGFILAEKERTIVMFRNNDANLRDIWGTVSTNGGMSFEMGADIDQNNWMINSCPSSGPNGYTVGDTMYYTWMSGASGYSKINIGSVNVNTLEVGVNRELTPNLDFNQNYPKIAGDEKFTGIVWQENRGGNIDLWFNWSENGISGLGENDAVKVNLNTNGPQVNADIAYAENTFHITWQDNQARKVMYRTIRINEGTSAIDEVGSKAGITVYPNPASERIHFRNNSGLPVFAELFNAYGELIYRCSNCLSISVNNLISGIYFLKLTENGRDDYSLRKILLQK